MRIIPNMMFIRKHGIDEFMTQQKKRMALLETMIEEFDDGRSKSFYCRAAAMHDPGTLQGAMAETDRKIRADKIKQDDRKTKAKTLKSILSIGS